MKVSIIIVTHNGVKDTLECLTSIKNLKRNGHIIETIVVDNASTDTTVSVIKQKFPEVETITNRENLGFAQGNNIGIKHALQGGADFILILNNDTVVHSDAIIELVSAAEKFPQGGIFSPKIYFAPQFETHPKRYKKTDVGKVIWYGGGMIDWANMLGYHRGVDEVDHGQYEENVKTMFGTGCSLLVRRAVFKKVGLLDKKFYLYYEDLDFSLRAKKKSFEIYYIPKAIVWHKNASASGGTGSDLQAYYITRNRLLIGMRYAPWRTKLALFREATNLIMHGTPIQKQAVGDFLRKKYGAKDAKYWNIPSINLLKLFKKTSSSQK